MHSGLRKWHRVGLLTAGLSLAPLASELRLSSAARRPSESWRSRAIISRGEARLGVSFRPLQAEALGLEPGPTLQRLLRFPFDLVRLAAHWNRIEPTPGGLDTSELDRYLAQVEQAGKQVVLAVGAVKNFGYPEFFVPDHQLSEALPEHQLVTLTSHPELANGARRFVGRIIERYRDRPAICAWQVEHEAVDPLGLEHSWRLGADFVAQEVAAVRALDPTRPILLNGFLPTSTPVSWMQRWRTRDQGDSLAVAQELADIVGVDYYSRHAVLQAGGLSLYLDGGRSAWRQGSWRRLGNWSARTSRRVMVSEGQAEPWEAVTVPPSPTGRVSYSCPPERVIDNFNHCFRHTHGLLELDSYLFWGGEYWMRRQAEGDGSYLGAFRRILEES
ncbi:MAG: beta-galactosidase [Candidatus Dormibacteria bacterium]